jgi:sulfatase maturation enzyme AslB (radical SAM superfamily)
MNCPEPDPMSDTRGKHFCILPFVHLHMESSGNLTPCAINCERMGNVRDGKLDDLWKSEKYVHMRSAMLADEYVPSCEICYSQERGKGYSVRTLTNRKFERFLADPGTAADKPVYFDLRFSNLCNLKCRSCEHKSSSLWFDDAKALQLAAGSEALLRATDDPKELLAQIRAYIPAAVEFYFAGGEPLVMEEHYEILDMLIEAGRTDVHLVYNSNFMKTQFKGKSVFEYWQKFRGVTLCISLDAVDTAAAYVRKGTRFASIIENRRLLRELAPHVQVLCTPTISLLNLGSLMELLTFLLDTDFCPPQEIKLNILEYPLYYNIKAAPRAVKDTIRNELTTFAAGLANHPDVMGQIDNVISYMESGDLTEQLDRFKSTTLTLDRLRNESYRDVYDADDPVSIILNSSDSPAR